MDDAHKNILREHLPYEIDLLEQCIEAWRKSTPASIRESKEVWAKREMPKNGFWLHARNLIEFFETSAADRQAAAADHFTTKPRHYEMPSKETKQKIHAQIAHLNYDRVTEFGKLTFDDALRIKSQIDRAVAEFQDHLTAEAQALWEKRAPIKVLYENLPSQSSTASWSKPIEWP